jgi:hypothetical protein
MIYCILEQAPAGRHFAADEPLIKKYRPAGALCTLLFEFYHNVASMRLLKSRYIIIILGVI